MRLTDPGYSNWRGSAARLLIAPLDELTLPPSGEYQVAHERCDRLISLLKWHGQVELDRTTPGVATETAAQLNCSAHGLEPRPRFLGNGKLVTKTQ